MSLTGQRVVKNASILMVGQLITWGLALLLTIFMPRFLGPAAIGRYQLAVSLWAIVSIFITFGMDMLMTKEIARRPEKTSELVSITLILRSMIFVAGFVALILYTRLVGYPAETLILILILGAATWIGQLTGAFQAALQGLERMEYVSISDILSKTFVTLVAIILLFAGYGIEMIAFVVVGGALLGFLVQYLALKRVYPLRMHFQWLRAKWMMLASFPYFVNVGVRTAYIQIDVVILSLLVSDVVLGWYSGASRLFSTFLFIPTVLMMAVFPTMSRMHTADPSSMPKMMRKNFDLMLLFGVPIGLGLVVMASPLVTLLFGPEFANSGPVLSVMGLVLILTYQNMFVGAYLISSDRQHIWTWVMAIATLATIPLDLGLIRYFQAAFGNGALGGAVSFFITEAGMLAAGMWLLPKGTFQRSNAWTALRIFSAGTIMAGVSWLLRDQFILIPVLAGAAVYISFILVLKVIPREDWLLIQTMLHKVFARVRRPKTEPTVIGD